MAGKAKKASEATTSTTPPPGGSEVRDMTLPSLGYLGAKFSETSFPDYANRLLLSFSSNNNYSSFSTALILVLLNWAENNHVVVYDFPV